MHSAGAPPQTPLGELSALPRLPSWILGGLTSKGRKGRRRGEDRGREEWGKRAQGGQGQKGERGGRRRDTRPPK